MKKCLSCGQKNGIKDSHEFCHKCGGALFEIEVKKIIVGAVKKMDKQNENMLTLQDYKTCELVEELKKREGVGVINAEPHTDKTITVNGPATVLVVID